MKEDRVKMLIEKYKEGMSTLSEDQFLFNKAKSSEPSLEAWSTFVKNNKIETPENFNDNLWKSFQNKKIKKHKTSFLNMSIAASVILLITFFIATLKQKQDSYFEKEALLNEALDMVSNSPQSGIEQQIIYENDMVIIYTTTE